MLISKRAVVPPKKFKNIIKARIRVYDIVEKVFASEIKPCDVFSCMHECMRKKTQSMKLKLSHDILATQAYKCGGGQRIYALSCAAAAVRDGGILSSLSR